MRRRHLLALVILALVVATVVAVGPMRVWDWMTLRTVEERLPNGNRCRYRCRLWIEPSFEQADAFEIVDESGRKRVELTLDGIYRDWAENGDLESAIRLRNGKQHGIETTEEKTISSTGTVISRRRLQEQYVNGVVVETRTSPPWFTAEQILQSVEGVEE